MKSQLCCLKHCFILQVYLLTIINSEMKINFLLLEQMQAVTHVFGHLLKNIISLFIIFLFRNSYYYASQCCYIGELRI
ncbi:hypothetical protein EB796_000703 [Bugula neritina]|uniref:Uncharacterized protein n=1 Tax=Bugula neritina TaxID=10212 RepID=A0A7J7KS08_BUGNE|nr:hypothetical protein EB796_000703 [Bugula neritina]